MIWPFHRRKAAPPAEDNRTSADWRVGDLAVCIRDSWVLHASFNPKKDEVLRVNAVVRGPATDGSIIIGLGFEGKPSGVWWHNIYFRKAQISHEPADARFTELIKRWTKAPEPAHG